MDQIRALGGLKAIAISHPHFYAAMVDWSRAFDNIPIYIHGADRSFVMRPDPAIVFWEGSCLSLSKECTLIHCGGHFEGSSVLHWARGAEGRGALLTGDTIFVTQDTRYVSFMYSYPNLIPLGAKKIRYILKAIQHLSYDRIYNGWLCCESHAQQAVALSSSRYLEHIGEENMNQESYPEFLYKIVSTEDWEMSALGNQVIRSSMDTDFIHLAMEDQIPYVVEKFWKHREHIVLKLASKQLVGRLVYETNPGGSTQYCHLYDGHIPLDAVVMWFNPHR